MQQVQNYLMYVVFSRFSYLLMQQYPYKANGYWVYEINVWKQFPYIQSHNARGHFESQFATKTAAIFLKKFLELYCLMKNLLLKGRDRRIATIYKHSLKF